MELPIAQQSYRPSTDALVRAIKRVDVMFSRVLAEEEALDGALVFTNAERPNVHMANGAYEVQLHDGDSPDALLDRIEAHFADAGMTCCFLQSALPDWPAPLAEAAEARGFEPVSSHLHCLDHYTPPAHRAEGLQIIPARAAYGELHGLFAEEARVHMAGDDAFADEWAQAMIDRLDEARFEFFLGRIDRQPVGVAGVVSLGQIGVIDGVYTAPSARRQGVCGALMAHTIEHCRRALFEHVVLEVRPGTDAERLYERIGFSQAATIHGYSRRDAPFRQVRQPD